MSHSTYLVDADKLFRAGLTRLFDDTPCRIVYDTSGVETIEGCAEPPELILLGITEQTDEDAVAILRGLFPEARIVVLSQDIGLARMGKMFDQGANGYLVKSISPEALVQSLNLVMAGQNVYPSELAMLITRGPAEQPQARSSRGLSEREHQILQGLLRGESNKMIALKLGITEATVKVHLKSLLRKINVRNRTQAAIWAMNNGLDAEAA